MLKYLAACPMERRWLWGVCFLLPKIAAFDTVLFVRLLELFFGSAVIDVLNIIVTVLKLVVKEN